VGKNVLDAVGATHVMTQASALFDLGIIFGLPFQPHFGYNVHPAEV
jgi:hypothetical protein